MPVNFKLHAITRASKREREREKCTRTRARERESAPVMMCFQQRMRHGQGEDLL